MYRRISQSIGAVACIVMAVMALVFAAGCTPSQQQAALSGAGLVADGKSFDDVLQSGEVESAVFSAVLSDDDQATVINAFNEYAVSRQIVGELVKDPQASLSLRATIVEEHIRLRGAYLQVQDVVESNWDSYSAIDQSRLKRWQAQAQRLEIQYNNFMAAIDSEISSDVRYQRILEVLKIVAQLALMAV